MQPATDNLEDMEGPISSDKYYHPNPNLSGWHFHCVYPPDPNLAPLIGRTIVNTRPENNSNNENTETSSTKIPVSNLSQSDTDLSTPTKSKFFSVKPTAPQSSTTTTRTLNATQKRPATAAPRSDYILTSDTRTEVNTSTNRRRRVLPSRITEYKPTVRLNETVQNTSNIRVEASKYFVHSPLSENPIIVNEPKRKSREQSNGFEKADNVSEKSHHQATKEDPIILNDSDAEDADNEDDNVQEEADFNFGIMDDNEDDMLDESEYEEPIMQDVPEQHNASDNDFDNNNPSTPNYDFNEQFNMYDDSDDMLDDAEYESATDDPNILNDTVQPFTQDEAEYASATEELEELIPEQQSSVSGEPSSATEEISKESIFHERSRKSITSSTSTSFGKTNTTDNISRPQVNPSTKQSSFNPANLLSMLNKDATKGKGKDIAEASKRRIIPPFEATSSNHSPRPPTIPSKRKVFDPTSVLSMLNKDASKSRGTDIAEARKRRIIPRSESSSRESSPRPQTIPSTSKTFDATRFVSMFSARKNGTDISEARSRRNIPPSEASSSNLSPRPKTITSKRKTFDPTSVLSMLNKDATKAKGTDISEATKRRIIPQSEESSTYPTSNSQTTSSQRKTFDPSSILSIINRDITKAKGTDISEARKRRLFTDADDLLDGEEEGENVAYFVNKRKKMEDILKNQSENEAPPSSSPLPPEKRRVVRSSLHSSGSTTIPEREGTPPPSQMRFVRLSDYESSSTTIPESESVSPPRAPQRTAEPSLEEHTSAPRRERETDHPIVLSPEQTAIHDLVVRDEVNVFFTGAAGTGKSILLKHIIKTLRSKYSPQSVAVTAPTGIAAINIGGVTINRFAGVCDGEGTLDYYLDSIRCSNRTLKTWLNTKVLIIDEISMVNGDLLDMVETIARKIRRNDDPFGGIQTVFCGDFYQLPPVNSCRLAFESKCWRRVVQDTRMLYTPFRQKDMRFVDMLNDIRIGIVSAQTQWQLRLLERTPTANTNIEPTELYARKYQVLEANEKRLEQLPGSSFTFPAKDLGDTDLLRNCMAVRKLTLKVGAQVMLIKNMTDMLVNGSMGIVVGFTTPNKDKQVYPVVQFTNGIARTMFPETWEIDVKGVILATRTQIPLILSWAISIHKAQGKTIEYVKVDLSKIFETGQAYTALSRATDLDHLQVVNFHRSAIKTEPRVVAFYENMQEDPDPWQRY